MNVIMTFHKQGEGWFVLADKSDLLQDFGMCDGGIFGDAPELIVSRNKGYKKLVYERYSEVSYGKI